MKIAHLAILAIVVACQSPVTASAAAESAAALLVEQRTALLEQAPFRIEFVTNGSTTTAKGVRSYPETIGSAIFTKDGRFIINSRTMSGESTPQKLVSQSAWDGANLLRSADGQTTFSLSKSRFPIYLDDPADATLPERVPFVDLYEGMDPGGADSELSYDGIAIHLLGLDIFAYVNLHDMYYTSRPGKIGPRWCDVCDDRLFAFGVSLADADDSTDAAPARSKSKVISFSSVKRDGLMRGTSYLLQMKLAPAGASGRRVVEVTRRGPWLSMALQKGPNLTAADLRELSNVSGDRVVFTYADTIASGLFPSEAVSTHYEQPKNFRELPADALAAPQGNTNIEHGFPRSTSTWKVTAFEKLSDEDVQLLFDQFTMSQKRIVDLTGLPGWKRRYEGTDAAP